LRGAKRAYFQVKQPTKLDLVVNLIVPKALGLEVPPTLLTRTDEGDRVSGCACVRLRCRKEGSAIV